MPKEVWARADIPDNAEMRKKLFIAGLEAGADGAIVRPEDRGFAEFGSLPMLFNDNGDLSGAMSGKLVRLTSPNDQENALALSGKVDLVVLDASDWNVIPLENMIARFAKGTKVFACASSPAQAELYLTTLQSGADGVVAAPKDIPAIMKAAAASEHIELGTVTVTDVKNIGMGDRVCVDTCSMMRPGEGMLVGSQSSCMFLVQSESEEVGYVNARPFRVNAGAVHAYVCIPDGGTKYLSELKGGDPVIAVSSDGSVRTLHVGRCKVEQRPLILVEAETDDKRYTTVLQNAETVKVIGPGGAVSVAQLKKGATLYAKLEAGGRHFGMKIKEDIREI
jgi:3-dehydroquinate synthase II